MLQAEESSEGCQSVCSPLCSAAQQAVFKEPLHIQQVQNNYVAECAMSHSNKLWRIEVPSLREVFKLLTSTTTQTTIHGYKSQSSKMWNRQTFSASNHHYNTHYKNVEQIKYKLLVETTPHNSQSNFSQKGNKLNANFLGKIK